ncbi:four-carbon acid sugar kinase family protein [Pseudopedobacter sp.]|uniref:four-carbon acid sugar kinase family protein n=1 Tax=Pseudopedobacter sp. TaxID=1936787 RepID=UPI00333F3DED
MTSILVIADDLTGAAEIGGIALRYNLTVDIVHKLDSTLQSDVQILNTNTRSLTYEEIIPHLQNVTNGIKKDAYQFIYLKFDSALRGNIKIQVDFLKEQLNYKLAVFCPANPVFGRIIKNGEYYINDRLINETSFSEDPEFPIQKSHVLDILNAPEWELVKNVQQSQLETGCAVVEVSTHKELDQLAENVQFSNLMIGGSAFFNALLHQQYTQFKKGFREHIELNHPVLFVCGSAYKNSSEQIKKVKPDYLVYFDNNDSIEKLRDELLNKIRERSKVIFAVSPQTKGSAAEIRKKMAGIVGQVYHNTEVCELVIEGGATSYEILNELNIKTVTPVQEIGLGLIKTMVTDKKLFITLKPGSYPWTKELWKF